MPLTLITAPTVEPLHLDEVKQDRRIEADDTDQDAYLQALIVTAREYLDGRDGVLGRAMITQTWELSLDRFPCQIEVPLPPLQSVTSITYIDTAGDEQTLAASDYQVDIKSQPGRIKPAFGKTWPSTRCGDYSTVTVRFVAGYGDDWNSIPHPIRQAMFLLIGDHNEHREETVVGVSVEKRQAVDALLAGYKVWSF